jgi:hypothetical protein
MITEKDIDGFENYEERIANLLIFIKQQNIKQQKEDAWVESQNQKFKLKSTNKTKRKTKTQIRKEQLQLLKTQVPKMGNVSKFFNF